MFGLLNVHKPAGMTSRDVVNRVQRLVRPAKTGHAGTLDPLATGVLIVCVGPATRLIEYVQRMPKRYTGTFLLGRESDTEDIEGNVQLLDDAPEPTRAEIEAVLPQFVGRIQQQPPVYSALKVQGKAAYKRARAGETVSLAPRPIEIHRLEIVSYEYPTLVLDIACGGGTYVRSLGRDIARAVGTGAVMSALERTAIGPFEVASATALSGLTPESLAAQLISPLVALADLPRRVLTGEELRRLSLGQLISPDETEAGDEIVALTADGHLAAILMPHESGLFKPAVNFTQHLTE